jgi:hypothetical protein
MNFKKLSYLSLVLLLTACGTTVKPAMMENGQQGFLATCGGTAITWSKCYEAAATACATGFNIVDREQFAHDGFVKRNLYFTCK